MAAPDSPAPKPSDANPAADFVAGLVVFLVALPLCLGVALASNAPAFAGLIAGVVGGIVVGLISGSHTSVSGPAAGLTAVVAAQIGILGSFQVFLLAVVIAGVIQVGLGIARAGSLAAFVPSGVINGLLCAIGVILILKQIPHLFGHDADPEDDMAFLQPDGQNTFSELFQVFNDLHLGAAVIGLGSLALLFGWDRVKPLKKSLVPAPLIVVLLGVGLAELFRTLGGSWVVEPSHLVNVPVATTLEQFQGFLTTPDWKALSNGKVYVAAVTIAAVASLETLLNLEAVDKLDPRRRASPPSRELIAQGVGNVASGLIGGLPVTSVIVRSSVNINAGARSKVSAVFHGVLLLGCVSLLPGLLNRIPLSCLAAILIHTGLKLASPKLFKTMWSQGRYQFIPFILTVVAIVLTDLLIGVLLGLAVSLAFILRSNLRRPVRVITERHLRGEVTHVMLANQVSFLNRAALDEVLNNVPEGGRLILDAQDTDYVDPDVLAMVRDFTENVAPNRDIEVSLLGFRARYHIESATQFVDFSSRDLQDAMTPSQVLEILKDGHARFRAGRRLQRDLGKQISATAAGQHPLAVILSCIDSRTPAELIFDTGVGDIFVVRVAGNVTSRKILGSVEFACAVAGAKLILVMGHTRCGAVTAAVKLADAPETAAAVTGCQHLGHIVTDIAPAAKSLKIDDFAAQSPEEQSRTVDAVARENVALSVVKFVGQSETIARLVREGKVAVVGAMYDVATGDLDFLPQAVDSEDGALVLGAK